VFSLLLQENTGMRCDVGSSYKYVHMTHAANDYDKMYCYFKK